MDMYDMICHWMDWIEGDTKEQRQERRRKGMEQFMEREENRKKDLNALRQWAIDHGKVATDEGIL